MSRENIVKIGALQLGMLKKPSINALGVLFHIYTFFLGGDGFQAALLRKQHKIMKKKTPPVMSKSRDINALDGNRSCILLLCSRVNVFIVVKMCIKMCVYTSLLAV